MQTKMLLRQKSNYDQSMEIHVQNGDKRYSDFRKLYTNRAQK
jgi:hypothetical protein